MAMVATDAVVVDERRCKSGNSLATIASLRPPDEAGGDNDECNQENCDDASDDRELQCIRCDEQCGHGVGDDENDAYNRPMVTS